MDLFLVIVGLVALVAASIAWYAWACAARRQLRTNMLAHDCEMDMQKLDAGDPEAIYGEYPPDPMFRPH